MEATQRANKRTITQSSANSTDYDTVEAFYIKRHELSRAYSIEQDTNYDALKTALSSQPAPGRQILQSQHPIRKIFDLRDRSFKVVDTHAVMAIAKMNAGQRLQHIRQFETTQKALFKAYAIEASPSSASSLRNAMLSNPGELNKVLGDDEAHAFARFVIMKRVRNLLAHPGELDNLWRNRPDLKVLYDQAQGENDGMNMEVLAEAVIEVEGEWMMLQINPITSEIQATNGDADDRFNPTKPTMPMAVSVSSPTAFRTAASFDNEGGLSINELRRMVNEETERQKLRDQLDKFRDVEKLREMVAAEQERAQLLGMLSQLRSGLQ